MAVYIKEKFPLWARILRKTLRSFNFKFFLKTYLYIADSFYSAADHVVLSSGNNVHPKIDIIRYHEFFLKYIDKSTNVLDIGSHNGNIAFRISKYCKTITGIEIDEKNFKEAITKNKTENVFFIHGDINNTKFSKKFDVCIMSNVLEHIEKRILLLKKLLKVTNCLLIRVPAIDRDWWPVYRKELGIEWRCDTTHFIEYTKEDFYSEFTKAGWSIEEYHVQWGEIYAVCKPYIMLDKKIRLKN